MLAGEFRDVFAEPSHNIQLMSVVHTGSGALSCGGLPIQRVMSRIVRTRGCVRTLPAVDEMRRNSPF